MSKLLADITPLAVTAARAAALLSMSEATFRRRVDEGCLPKARVLGARRVWSVRELEQAIMDCPQDGDLDIVTNLDADMGL